MLILRIFFLGLFLSGICAAQTPREVLTRSRFTNDITGAPPMSAPTMVEWFGAKGDGTTDDTTAITNAVTAAGANGLVLFQAGKTYIVSGDPGVVVGVNNITLMGYGATIKSPTQSGHNITHFSLNGRTGVKFIGLTFDCKYTSGAPNPDRGQIDIITSTRITIRDCTFQNTQSIGVRLLGATQDCEITGCRFLIYGTALTGNQDGVAQPTNMRIHGNYLGASLAGVTGGITFHGLAGAPYGGHTISGNVIEVAAGQFMQCIELQTRVDCCTVVGNTIRGGFGATMGISLSGSNRMIVNGNLVSSCTDIGIEIAGCSDVVCADNNVNMARPDGTAGTANPIGIGSAANGVTITGNTITGNFGNQIDLQLASNVIISGNFIKTPVDADASGGRIMNAKDYTNLSLCNNHFNMAGGSGGFFLDSTDQVCSGLSIVGNVWVSPLSGNGCGGAFVRFYGVNIFEKILITGNNTANAKTYPDFGTIGSSSTVNQIRVFSNVGNGTPDITPNGEDRTSFNIPVVYTSLAYAQGASFDIKPWHEVLMIDASGEAKTPTLPTAVGVTGKQFTITKTDNSGNAVTVGTTSSQTISGNNAAGTYVSATTYALAAQGARVTVESNGANYVIVQAR